MKIKANHFWVYVFVVLGVVISTPGSSQCNFSNGPEGELCTSAIYICGSELDGFTGKLPEKLSASQQWLGLCNGNGTADNIIWFSFTVCSKKVCLEIIPSNCTTENGLYSGIQAGLFTDCARSGSVACTDPSTNNGMTSPVTLCYDNFTPGQIAYFFVDGYAKSVCDFRIRVIEGIDTTKIASPDPSGLEEGAITGPNTLNCNQMHTPIQYNLTPPADTVIYSNACRLPQNIDPSDSICYVWQVNPVAGRLFVGMDSVGRSVQLQFSSPGTYTLSADAYFHPFFGGSCANAATGKILTWTVTVAEPDTLDAGKEFVCPGKTVDFCGNPISVDGVYYCRTSECEVVQKQFVFGTSRLNDMGEKLLCQGESFFFMGRYYSVPGDYEVQDDADCALLHRFRISVAAIQYAISAPVTVLTCSNSTIQMQAVGSASHAVRFLWTDASGSVLGQSSSLQVQKGGLYFLEVSIQGSQSSCRSLLSLNITENKTLPAFQLDVPTVGCNGRKSTVPKPVITLTTSDALAGIRWILPDGKIDTKTKLTVDSILVASGDPIFLEVTGVNGCKRDSFIIVPTNFQKPVVALQGDNLTCFNPKDTLELTSSMVLDSIRWSRSLPKEVFYSSYGKDFLPIDMEGTYKVEVMAKINSCWTQDSIQIEDLIQYPTIQFASPMKWHCNTDSLAILPIIDLNSGATYVWSTLDGKIGSSANQKNMVALSPGFYFLKVQNDGNGCVANEVLHIEEETNVPTAILLDQTEIRCHGDRNGEILINGVKGGFGPYAFALDGKTIDDRIVGGLGPGTYALEVSDQYGCTYTTNTAFTDPPLFEIFSDVTDIDAEYADQITLSLYSNFASSDIDSYSWTDNQGNIVFDSGSDYSFPAQSDLQLLVKAVTDKGCIDTIRFRIRVNTELSVQLPNIFSPNGDGSNDLFTFEKNKVPAQINYWHIYDRWGNLVYASTASDADQQEGWDGSWKGKPLDSGVYVLVMEITDVKGSKKILQRDLTLIR